MGYVAVKYFHLIAVLMLFATLVLEHTLIKRELSSAELKKIARIDLIYGISAAVVLIAGLLMWLLVGKPADFYTANPLFHLKLGLFVLVGLVSVYPTLFFVRQRASRAAVIKVPQRLIMLIRFELVAVPVLLLLAVLMAQGVGLS